MLVYKKALICRDSELWIWDYVILTLDVDPSTVVRPYRVFERKMRSPRATVISCEAVLSGPMVAACAATDAKAAYMAKVIGQPLEPPSSGNIYSWYDLSKYEVGREVVADSFDDNPEVSCTHGIHFFATKEEAKAYYF